VKSLIVRLIAVSPLIPVVRRRDAKASVQARIPFIAALLFLLTTSISMNDDEAMPVCGTRLEEVLLSRVLK
jgi:hypothetical protein